MTIRRLPLFVWMVLVNSFVIVLALPALNAALVMLLLDRLLQASLLHPRHRRHAHPVAALPSGSSATPRSTS